MSKHTPGPWKVIPRDGNIPNAVQRGREGGFSVCGLDNETEDADARLIAAAPDLLEVAKHCEHLFVGYALDRIDGEEIADKALALIRAAIAKATGE